MTAASAVSARPKARRQFQALFQHVIPFKATLDNASVADAESKVATVAVPGAALGDFVLISFGVDQGGLTATAYVSQANEVTVITQNDSAGAIDLASTTIKGLVLSPSPQLFY